MSRRPRLGLCLVLGFVLASLDQNAFVASVTADAIAAWCDTAASLFCCLEIGDLVVSSDDAGWGQIGGLRSAYLAEVARFGCALTVFWLDFWSWHPGGCVVLMCSR